MATQPVYLVNPPVHLDFDGGITPKGEYVAETAYATGDGVSYNGSSYVAIQATTGNVPTNTTYWQLLANKGDTGDTGPSGLSELSADTSPQLGGDLDLNDNNILLKNEPTADSTASGLIISVTVDTNAQGIGAPLFVAADGHFDTADADATATAPSVVIALEVGTGLKKVLVHGVVRNDSWNWTTGPGEASIIYLSTSVGELTQTKPTGTDDVVQPVGWAISDDCMYFSPSLLYFTCI